MHSRRFVRPERNCLLSRFLIRGCALALTAVLLVPSAATAAVSWQRVGTGITEGVSGLAVLSGAAPG